MLLPYSCDGRFYRYDGVCIEGVTLFMVGGSIQRFGAYADVFRSFNAWVNVFSERASDCLFINLENRGLDADSCCYILRRLLLKPNGNFAKEFRARVDTDGFISWLGVERSRVPIPLDDCDSDSVDGLVKIVDLLD